MKFKCSSFGLICATIYPHLPPYSGITFENGNHFWKHAFLKFLLTMGAGDTSKYKLSYRSASYLIISVRSD